MSEPGSALDRFVQAQAQTWAGALAELLAGRKQGHWIWFVLPQLAGLGRSDMAWQYGIEDLQEARAYLAHPLLGPRLREACPRSTVMLAGARWPREPLNKYREARCETRIVCR